MTKGSRIIISGVTAPGYTSFNGRTGTVTKTYSVTLGADSAPTKFVVVDVDDYPWGFQTLASTVEAL